MGISPEEFVRHFPNIYHMADGGSWEGLQKHGLLSVSALLDLFEVEGEKRRDIEERRRLSIVEIKHPIHGRAVIRDQKPLAETALQKCLAGMTPSQWYRYLNSKAFFWVTKERVLRLLQARAYRDTSHCVLTIDTKQLLSRYKDVAELSPINSGSAIFNPQPRGKQTFLPLNKYPFSKWAQKRGSPQNAVVELTIPSSVPDLMEFTIRAELKKQSRILRTLYRA